MENYVNIFGFLEFGEFPAKFIEFYECAHCAFRWQENCAKDISLLYCWETFFRMTTQLNYILHTKNPLS